MAEANPGLIDKLELIEIILVDNWRDVCYKVKFEDLIDEEKLAHIKAIEFKDKLKDPRFTEEERAIVSMANLKAIRRQASRSRKERETEELKKVDRLSEEKRELEQQKESIEKELVVIKDTEGEK